MTEPPRILPGPKFPPDAILVVESDAGELSQTVGVLRGAGYQVVAASEFGAAKRVLASVRPSLLITGVRLGAYNGLHLIVRSRVDHPNLAAILTNQALDPVLKAEAERQQALYLFRPWTDQDLLRTVEHSLQTAISPMGSVAIPQPRNTRVSD
jgi:DNA-binding NtrC family response regulator